MLRNLSSPNVRHDAAMSARAPVRLPVSLTALAAHLWDGYLAVRSVQERRLEQRGRHESAGQGGKAMRGPCATSATSRYRARAMPWS